MKKLSNCKTDGNSDLSYNISLVSLNTLPGYFIFKDIVVKSFVGNTERMEREVI